MPAECTTVDLREDPDRDWRRAHEKAIDGMRTQLLRERAEGNLATYDAFGRTWWVAKLSDEDLHRVAVRYADRITETAIRQHESEIVEERVKRRGGRAQ